MLTPRDLSLIRRAFATLLTLLVGSWFVALGYTVWRLHDEALKNGMDRAVAHARNFEELLTQDLQNRIAYFDADAATHAAKLAAHRKAQGRPVDMRDTFIAGIALSRRATLATRNTKHFDDLTTPVINPWAD